MSIRTLGAAALAISLAACSADRTSEPSLWTSDWKHRTVTTSQWDTLWAIGSANDTVLLNPFLLSSDGDRLFVFDGGKHRVIAFHAASGERLWEFGGEGAGPDEFRGPRDLKADGFGGIYVLDPRNNRIAHLDREGSVLRRIPLNAVGHAEQMAPLAGGRVALVTENADSAVVVLDSAGSIEGRIAIPWNAYQQLEGLSRQGYVAARNGNWVFGFSIGNGWFGFQDARARTESGRYVEHTAFPRVVTSNGPHGSMKQLAEYNPCSACSLSLSDSILYVHFGGYTDARKKVLDRYRLTDGEYLGSWELPAEAMVVEVVRNTVFTLAEEPYPTITALRPLR